MRQVSLRFLAKMFGWIGVTSVGGGRSAYVYEILVERKGWMTAEEFLPGLAMCQLLPGPTIANLAVYLGHGLRGLPGAVLALLAVLLPGALAILALAAVYFSYGVTPGVDAALVGMGAAVAGFLCVTVGRMGLRAMRSRGAYLIAGITFAAVGLLRMNTMLVIILVGAMSLWLNRPGKSLGQPHSRDTGR